MHEPYLSDVPVPSIALHPAVPAARARVIAAAHDLLAVPDAALERAWPWRDDEVDVRYGFYHAFEVFEAATGAVRRTLDEAGTRPAPGARRAAAATAARWDLHGRLLPLDATNLDAAPGAEEWTLRQTLGHVVRTQRAYGRFTVWWLLQRDAATPPDAVPEALFKAMPEEAVEGQGTLEEICARLDGLLDAGMAHLGGLDNGALAVPARWSGIRVDVGFRLGRWSSHIREHTVQVDKTLAMIGWAPREVDRLVGLVVGAYGRLEEQVFGLPAAALERGGDDGRTPATLIEAVTMRVAADAASVRAWAST
jgi:hypothetical protein